MRKHFSSRQLEKATLWLAGGLVIFFVLASFGVFPRFSMKKGETPASEISDVSINFWLTPFTVEHRYANAQQKGLDLFRFNLLLNGNVWLKRLKISSSSFNAKDQIQSLQLYQNGVFIKEVPFFDGFGLFEDLNIPVIGLTTIEIQGTMSDEAKPGNVVRIGLAHDFDITLVNDQKQKIAINLSENTKLSTENLEFPLWGNYITIIDRQ